MQTDWIDFVNNEITHAPNFSDNADFLCATEHLGLIQIDGEDALSFLQNQLSNDIAKIDENTCQLNSYSNHKGRMYSIFYVIKNQGGYLLIVPKSQIEFLLQRLQMFVIMAKVTLSDVSNQWAKMGFNSNTTAHSIFAKDQLIKRKTESVYIRLNPNNLNRVLVLNAFDSAVDNWASLRECLTVCDTNAWLLAEINEGIPSLSPETSEAFVLQMSNLHLLNGVSFKKGCFPGQEIVARTKYLGKAKRRMYLFRVESSTQPLPIEQLCDLSSNAADGSGKVVLSAQSDALHYDFLCVANIEKAEANTLKLVNQPNAKLIIKKLPYSFEE